MFACCDHLLITFITIQQKISLRSSCFIVYEEIPYSRKSCLTECILIFILHASCVYLRSINVIEDLMLEIIISWDVFNFINYRIIFIQMGYISLPMLIAIISLLFTSVHTNVRKQMIISVNILLCLKISTD